MHFNRTTALAASLGSVISLGSVTGCGEAPQITSIAGNAAKTKVTRPDAKPGEEQEPTSFASPEEEGPAVVAPLVSKRGETRVVMDSSRVDYREITAIGVQGDSLYIGVFERALDPVDSKRALLQCSIKENCAKLNIIDIGNEEISSPFGMSKSGEDLFIYGQGALIKTYTRNILRIKSDGRSVNIKIASEGLSPQTFYGVTALGGTLVVDGVFDVGPSITGEWYRSSLFSSDGGDTLHVLKGARASRFATFGTATRLFALDEGESKAGTPSGSLYAINSDKGTLIPYLTGNVVSAFAFGERVAGIEERADSALKRAYGHFICESDSSCASPSRFAFAERGPNPYSMLGTFGSELVFFAGLEQEKNTLEALTSIVSCSKEAMSLGPCKPIVIREKVSPHLGFDTSGSPKTAHAADSLFYIDQQSRIVRVQMK